MTLPCFKVKVLEPGVAAPRGWKPCVIGKDIVISHGALETYCFAEWNPIVYDALLFAGAVEFCDRSWKRPAGGWGRQFELAVPVHDPDHWRSGGVTQSIRRALQIVTGDRFELTFMPRKRSVTVSKQRRLDFGDNACVVIPFSDGLDSRAVAGLLQKSLGDRLIHVRLGAKQIDRPEHNGQRLPFTAVPYKVAINHSETSCRSRGFKFAMLSGLAAHLTRAKHIIMPESAQGALGPVLVPVMHGQPDYRNHPVFTRQMEDVVEQLLGSSVRYEFPRLWSTKAQTLRSFVDAGGTGWESTRSCWQKSRHMSVEGRLRQCGFCAACLLRRLSVHGTGLREARDAYMMEELSAPTLKAGMAASFTKLWPKQHRYADAAILHLDHLAQFQASALSAPSLRRHVRELSEALRIAAEEAQARLCYVLNEHEHEWRSFCDAAGANSYIAAQISRAP